MGELKPADIAAAVLAIAKDPPDYVLAALSLILGEDKNISE